MYVNLRILFRQIIHHSSLLHIFLNLLFTTLLLPLHIFSSQDTAEIFSCVKECKVRQIIHHSPLLHIFLKSLFTTLLPPLHTFWIWLLGSRHIWHVLTCLHFVEIFSKSENITTVITIFYLSIYNNKFGTIVHVSLN